LARVPACGAVCVHGGQEARALPHDSAAFYRPRDSPLFRLVDAFYDEVKGRWEEDFEPRNGFWRGSVEDAVSAGLAEVLREVAAAPEVARA
jgi:hypothetical protein